MLPQASSSSRLLQGGFETRWGHGQLPQATAGGVEDGVSHDRSRGDNRRLATTRRRRFQILDEDGLDPGQPGKTRDLISVEVAVEHGTILEAYFLSQGVTQSHGDAAFHLLARTIGIHSDSLILGADDPLDVYISGAFVDCDLGHRR